MKTVYLCGGINGLGDAECRGWREEAKRLLGERFRTLDPMRRDYRGTEGDNVDEIVRGDLADIDASSVVLVNASRPSWGTAMEVFYAYGKGKWVVAWGCSGSVSPWLQYHSDNRFETLGEAVTYIVARG